MREFGSMGQTDCMITGGGGSKQGLSWNCHVAEYFNIEDYENFWFNLREIWLFSCIFEFGASQAARR